MIINASVLVDLSCVPLCGVETADALISHTRPLRNVAGFTTITLNTRPSMSHKHLREDISQLIAWPIDAQDKFWPFYRAGSPLYFSRAREVITTRMLSRGIDD